MKKILLSTIILSTILLSNDDFEKEFENKTTTNDENIILESYNRFMTKFNDKTYTYFLKPISQGWEYIIPEVGRTSINNVFNNLMFPVKFTNSILQLKFEKAFVESQRFIINSTIGVLGIMDPAKNHFDLNTSPEDFGQTLAFYGVGEGPYIVLPFLGPSNLRDSISLIPDYYISLNNHIKNREYNLYNNDTTLYIFNGIDIINRNSFNYKIYDHMKKDSIDHYLYLKSAYSDYRNELISK